ncbi:FAD binding domain-containing protein [Dactylonectria estremocensis]|uniref:FAD binding domain-containing protein n=1 Tax=Dactylonectria estremocensis TaxID=1079267 RepID=A0A9P9EG08_9HYPO|nr:FAD binding domain-containing protein [Dactylonectria estremocensis]
MEEVDVAIIGGGPTGLFTGLLLHQLGVSVSILDAKPESLDLGRADALNARTQQYFEVAKILDELLPQGLKCNTSSTFGNGEFKSRQNQWWVGIEHALHKNFLMIGQPVVERLIANRLTGRVHYNEQVLSITEGESSVEIVTKSGRKVRSKFALGADGAKSTIRSALGLTFAGTKPEMLWAVLDTFIDTDFPVCPEIITFELDGQSRVSWIPRERGLCRFYVLLEGEVTQELAEQSIKKHMAPYRVDFLKTEWYSTFDVKERIASSFISKEGSGRIFLAGDAAHVHSVNGGQGLNTGIADAFGLAWRLAMSLRPDVNKEAAANLLLSYDIERRSTAQEVIGVAAALVRDTVHEAKKYVSTIQRNAAYITGMGVSYDGLASPLIKESEHDIWKAGHRCPDIIVKAASSAASTRLYAEASYGKFLVLLIGKHPESAFNYSSIADVYHILPSEEQAEPGQEVQSQTTEGNRFTADWVKSDDSFVVVVRPDIVNLLYLMFEEDMFIEIRCMFMSSERRRNLREAPPAAPPPHRVAASVPNGGLQAWLQVAGSFCLYFGTWGLVSSYGTFQAIYEADRLSQHTPFQISVVGSLQTFLMVFLGFVVGPLYDAGYFRHLLTAGSLLIVVGTVLQSLCHSLWQFILTQGVLVGVGAGCLSILSVAITSSWFTTKLPLANGIAASGSGFGGVLLPIMLRELYPKIGLPWAVRALALLLLVLLGASNLVLRARDPRSQTNKRRPFIDSTAFRDWPYLLFVAGCFVVFLGMYTPFVYIQSYALDEGIVSPNFALYFLAILNAGSIFGRILPSFVAQRIGSMNMIIGTTVILSVTSLSLLTAKTQACLIAAIVFHGFFTGTFFALQPTIFVRLTADPSKIGTRFGMAFSVMSVALLFGSPISGALRKEMGYGAAWVWAGMTIFCGGMIILASRVLRRQWTKPM